MTLLKQETTPPAPYNFTVNDECTWFEFTTVNGICYEVTFIKSPGLFFHYPELSQLVYEMSILVTEEKAIPFDFCVQLTIAAVIRCFFESNRHVLLFVCDSMDERQMQRKLKFDRWYEEAGAQEAIEKYDGCIAGPGFEIYSSIILRTDFELKAQILHAFFDIKDQRSAAAEVFG